MLCQRAHVLSIPRDHPARSPSGVCIPHQANGAVSRYGIDGVSARESELRRSVYNGGGNVDIHGHGKGWGAWELVLF